jgi:RNA polymerase sigma-70 factor, ECF subfamily
VNQAFVETLPLTGAAPAEGFAELYERTFPRVYAYVASLLRDRSAAEDVTAQAFERAYRKRRSYRPARGSMDAWLFGIARNAALDELRRRKRRARLEVDPEDTGSPAPEDHAELAVRRETVRAALASLDGQERDLIALKFAGGLSNGEIARVLRLSESNVGTRLHRTITKLREACHD